MTQICVLINAKVINTQFKLENYANLVILVVINATKDFKKAVPPATYLITENLKMGAANVWMDFTQIKMDQQFVLLVKALNHNVVNVKCQPMDNLFACKRNQQLFH